MIKRFSKISKFLLAVVLISGWIFSGWPQIYNFPPKIQEAQAAPVTIYLLVANNSAPWDVPADWNDSNNTIEVIGAGGGGSNLTTGGGGGGGGAYSKSVNVNLDPAVNAEFTVGTGGGTETAGGDTWFCNNTTSCANFTDTNVVVSADGGAGANTSTAAAGAGGTTGGVSNVPTEFAGGPGGAGSATGDDSTGGGGGAGSPNGVGGTGGAGDSSTTGDEANGGGGASGDDGVTTDNGTIGGINGGGGGDSNGNASSGGTGGTTANGNPGTDGGGGGGGDGVETTGYDGGMGGDGQEWDSTHGSGGGGGGGDEAANGIGGGGGLYGGGGGGGATPGSGANGIIVIIYTPAVVISAPTVTTQAATLKEATTATCNGTITVTGGANSTNAGCEWDIDTGAPYANTVSTAGDYGAAPFTQALTGLPAGTTIYARAFATNSAGTSYGSEVNFLTKPAAPTNVATTKTLSDKVTVTWTKSTGATNYHVWRDSTDLGATGDVATFDDTGAVAPTVTAGTASATDGSATDKVTLSISGASANNGTTYTYKVVASNATGNSADSSTDTGYRAPGALTYQWNRSSGTGDSGYSTLSGATTAPFDDTTAPAPTITAGTADASDGTSMVHVVLGVSGQSASTGAVRYYYATVSATGASSADTTHNSGYRGVGTLTYQWQMSAGDSDANYLDIVGATTASYNDTGAPVDGSGRYYKVIENATGANQQITAVNRGYRMAAVISASVSPATTNYGVMAINQVRKADTGNANDEFIVTNTGNVAEDFDIISGNAIGGTGWTLSTTAVGSSIFMHAYSTLKTLSASFTLGNTGEQTTKWVAMDTSPNYKALATNVAVSGTVDLVLELLSPSGMGDFGVSKDITVTIRATQH